MQRRDLTRRCRWAGHWATYLAAVLVVWAVAAIFLFENRYGAVSFSVWAAGLVCVLALTGLTLALRRAWGPGPVGARLTALGGAVFLALVVWQGATGLWYKSGAPSTQAASVPVPDTVVAATRVWIDADPACGVDGRSDVDDCWALALALRGLTGRIVGISTVSGNGSEATGFAILTDLMGLAGGPPATRPPVFRGATAGQGGATEASAGLIAALEDGPMSILALGPLTNLAEALRARPDLAGRIVEVVAVAGKAPGDLFHPGRQWWMHFRDFNICLDTEAAGALLALNVALTLVPFELSIGLRITPDDLDSLVESGDLGAWLAGKSRDWAGFWRDDLDQPGFSPFDLAAAAYLLEPGRFACARENARIGYDPFLVPFGIGRDLEVAPGLDGVAVRYCRSVEDGVLGDALALLARAP